VIIVKAAMKMDFFLSFLGFLLSTNRFFFWASNKAKEVVLLWQALLL